MGILKLHEEMNFPGGEVLGVYRFYIGWYMKHGIMDEFEGFNG
jgi:hypothetical protein